MTSIGQAKLAAVDRFIHVLKTVMPANCATIATRENAYVPSPTAFYYVKSEEAIKSFPVVDEVACFVIVKSPRSRNASTSMSSGSRGELGAISLGVVITFLHAGGIAERWGRDITQQEITLLRTEFYSEAIIQTIYENAIANGSILQVDLTRDDNAIDLSTEASPESGTVTTEWLVSQQVSIPTDKFEV